MHLGDHRNRRLTAAGENARPHEQHSANWSRCDISDQQAIVQVLGGTTGLSNKTTRARFLGESFRLPVSRNMLGRVFDGLGRPLDGGPLPLSVDRRDINGLPINPHARQYP